MRHEARRAATPAAGRRGLFRAAALVALALVAAPALATGAREGAASAERASVLPALDQVERLDEIGRGIGVVFSPDISTPANQLFYERLGFSYFESASWEHVIRLIEWRNQALPERRIETLLITSHGANGHGLKLQASKARSAARSYASIGGLQERLERAGVRLVLVAACNSGRLFRPGIYRSLNTRVRDPLFLPPTRGVVNGSKGFDPSASGVVVMRRANALKENTTEGLVADLSPRVRRALGLEAAPGDSRRYDEMRFVVSDMFLELMTDDPGLRLTSTGFAVALTNGSYSYDHSVGLYKRFIGRLDAIAARATTAP